MNGTLSTHVWNGVPYLIYRRGYSIMAFHCRMKLPALELTKHTAGSKTKCVVHRGADTETVSSSEHSCTSSQLLEEDFGTRMSQGIDDMEEPTHHELQSKADVRGWEQLRDMFRSVATECSAMPLGQLCVVCHVTAEFRCQDCGSDVFYCKDCFLSSHEKMHFFHVPEKWEVSIVRIKCGYMTFYHVSNPVKSKAV